jgi:hypothetical protein
VDSARDGSAWACSPLRIRALALMMRYDRALCWRLISFVFS